MYFGHEVWNKKNTFNIEIGVYAFVSCTHQVILCLGKIRMIVLSPSSEVNGSL